MSRMIKEKTYSNFAWNDWYIVHSTATGDMGVALRDILRKIQTHPFGDVNAIIRWNPIIRDYLLHIQSYTPQRLCIKDNRLLVNLPIKFR